MAVLGKIKGSISVAVFKTPGSCSVCPMAFVDSFGGLVCGHEDGPVDVSDMDKQKHQECPLMDLGYECDVTVDEHNNDNG